MASCSKPAKKLAEEGESTMTPNWLALPRDVTANILQRVNTFEIVTSACRVCPLWWKICKEPFMWRTIHMTDDYGNSPYNPEKVCRYAVDRSCGQLEEINIQNFGSDDLLNYIADSACQLRRLRLGNCVDISDKALCQVAMKLPLLEELDISYINLSKHSLEAFGRSCSLLKVFKYNWPWDICLSERDDVALAIAKTMPQLRHLQLKRNPLGENGSLAILEGCPLLQSLDLEGCFRVNILSGSLRRRCMEQIKDLQLPDDCSHGHYYYNYYCSACLYGSIG